VPRSSLSAILSDRRRMTYSLEGLPALLVMGLLVVGAILAWKFVFGGTQGSGCAPVFIFMAIVVLVILIATGVVTCHVTH
jgi:CHASE2 domain-containing sensor protein